MGRTTSKIHQKIEDLLAGNPLPKNAVKSVKKLTKSISKSDIIPDAIKSKTNKVTLATPESLSDNFSDKMLCDDSGFFEETLTSGSRDDHMYDISFSDTSSNILDSSYDAQEDQIQVCPEILPLRPLYFEIPGMDPLVTRSKVLEDIRSVLAKKNRGLVITGKSAAGKTSVLLDMVKHSYFGGFNSKTDSFYTSIVGYHFIQPSDPSTTDASRFVHSLAAQLTQHPALRAYRDFLLDSPDLVSTLSLRSIRENPSIALKRAILDPLRQLFKEDLIELDEAVILVDGLDHDTGNSISNLVATNILRFPHWLKLILTHRTGEEDLVKITHLPHLDLGVYSEQDITDYVESRIFNSREIMSHIVSNDRQRKNMLLVKLVNFIVEHSDGSYLYPKMLLNLVSNGYITIKSTSFHHLPQNISETFQLMLTIQFPTAASYEQAAQVFSLCLASPRPLFLPQVTRLLSSNLETNNTINLDYRRLSDLLLIRSDGSLMFIHPDFISWLTSDSSKRFQVAAIDGHNLFTKYYSSIDILHTSEAVDFIHHLTHMSLFSEDSDDKNPSDKYPSELDKKLLFLTYKVDKKLLMKCSRVISFNSFINHDSIRLLNISLGSSQTIQR